MWFFRIVEEGEIEVVVLRAVRRRIVAAGERNEYIRRPYGMILLYREQFISVGL